MLNVILDGLEAGCKAAVLSENVLGDAAVVVRLVALPVGGLAPPKLKPPTS